ncbi:hypothetical protein HDU96_004385 [Phlyctochytrium bullatum]|nr:hypothetical protein HDU96_004385 [Phlyctochytrium bullatum]
MGVPGLWQLLANNTPRISLPLSILSSNRLVLSGTLSETDSEGKMYSDGRKPLVESHAASSQTLIGALATDNQDHGEDRQFLYDLLSKDKSKEPGYHPFRVAIDVSAWFYPASTAEEDVTAPTVRTAFYKCVKLVRLGIIPVLVFDSLTNRPAVKRVTLGSSEEYTKVYYGVRKLAEAFKFPVLDAFCEAEAECAALNSLGLVDAVLSKDVDSLLFGGKLILRPARDSVSSESDQEDTGNQTPRKKRRTGTAKPDSVEVLSSSFIEKNTGIDRNGLILTALLSGSDC